MPGYRHLILVPGHAVWNLRGDPLIDANWRLKPFQNGEPRYFVEHIQAGVGLAAADPESRSCSSPAGPQRRAPAR